MLAMIENKVTVNDTSHIEKLAYTASPQTESNKPCRACDRRGSAARFLPFQISVIALWNRHNVLPSTVNSLCDGVRHSSRTAGTWVTGSTLASTARITRS